MIRIIIVDDHPVIREGIKKILEPTCEINVVDEVDSGEALIDRLYEQAYDVLLLDITLPGRTGIDILADVKRLAPSMAILIVSMHAEVQYAIRSLRAGADGYITKDKAPTELISAIRKISSGGKYISSTLAEQLVTDISRDSVAIPHERLSNRELQVLCMIARGKSVGEIAEALSLSVSTISTYHHRILEKMEMKNNSELIHYAIKNGLVD